MKFVQGIALPDSDTHFEAHLLAGELVDGKGTYQKNKLDAAVSLCPMHRRRLAVDVGGHCGTWSRVLAKHFDQVVAFEPVAELYSCFKANTADLPNVKLYGYALMDQRPTGGGESFTVRMSSGGRNSGNAHVNDNGDIKVPARCLDEFNFTNLDLLKIDVEGFEAFVVLGGIETIKKQRPVIVVEQKEANAERYGLGRFDAVDLLKSWGAVVRMEISGDHILSWP